MGEGEGKRECGKPRVVIRGGERECVSERKERKWRPREGLRLGESEGKRRKRVCV